MDSLVLETYMIRMLILGGLLTLIAFNIGSTETNMVNDAMQYGQCIQVEKVISCDSEYVVVSVKYK